MKMKHSTHKQVACMMQNGLRTFLFFTKSPFCIQLLYFLSLSSICFLALRSSKPRAKIPPSQNVDVFFTSVSAVTVSSMSTLEMEVFSDGQLIILTVFMFMGGEVFTSILGFFFRTRQMGRQDFGNNRIGPSSGYDSNVELEVVMQENPYSKQETGERDDSNSNNNNNNKDMLKRSKSMKTLTFVATCYLFVTNITGSALISIYAGLVPSAREVLGRKGLKIPTFSVFTAVSTFVNCGFMPTNENMAAFKKNPGLLLIVGPLVLLGNTLYPVCLRVTIWALERLTGREEYKYLLKGSSNRLGYDHLLSRARTGWLAVTVLGLVVVQMVVFCALEWGPRGGGGVMSGLSGYERFVGSLFQVVNTRHAGESVFDLSAVSPAVLVMFVFMMYLPPYTSFLPPNVADEPPTIEDEKTNNKKKKENINNYLKLSHLSYLVIFIILICITEREAMRSDPLNFNVLNVVVEVISAYGNVGFSVGYSCERRISSEGYCKDASYGFAGRWTQKGKMVLIVVMFFGRLKKFGMRGGAKYWNLS